MEVRNTVQEEVIKTIHKGRNAKKVKWLFEEILQVAEKRREVKGKGEKERSECRVPKNSKERKESLPQRSVQRNRGKQQNGKY